MSSTGEDEVERRYARSDTGDSSPLPVPRPSTRTVASICLSTLLFGGLALLCVGATWGVLAAVGVPAAVAVAGLGMVAYAFVLAQVLSRLGVI